MYFSRGGWSFSAGLIGIVFPLFQSAQAAEPAGFPSQPLRIVVPAPAEGGISLQARLLAPVMRAHLGQQVLVEHRAGAGGVIGCGRSKRVNLHRKHKGSPRAGFASACRG